MVGSDEYRFDAIRSREEVARIMTAREHKTITPSMVRTLEGSALDKFIAYFETVPVLRALLLAKTPDEIAQTAEWFREEWSREDL